MSKLNQEELLEHLEETMGIYVEAMMASDQLKQAYQQIRELIQESNDSKSK